ncbi:MAG: DUF998 domain-containing protein [Nitrososphaerota archaeon]|jgi:hypothetical protein|nr:DUF998 domain-containing protein [Nitrososphaerota archaeon]
MSDSQKSARRYRVTLAGVALYLVLDIVAQSLPPHYNPVSQAESDLAVGPYGFLMTLNFLNRGILSLEFMFALLGSIRLAGADLSRFRGGFYAFGAWSVGALLLAIFPTDAPATPVSWHGAIHLVVAIIAFLGGAFGALSISLGMRRVGALEGASRLAMPVSLLAVLLCLVELLAPFVVPHADALFGGLLERLFLGSVLVWIAVLSVYMVRSKSLHPVAVTQTGATAA